MTHFGCDAYNKQFDDAATSPSLVTGDAIAGSLLV